MKRIRQTGLCLILLLTIMVMACGKKGPPVPPGIPDLPPVTGFVFDLQDDFVTLAWQRPSGKGASILKGYIVYRSKTAVGEEPCTGCPILFEKAAEPHKGTESFGEMIQNGYDYIYKVVAVSEYGTHSPDSELLRFRFDKD